MASIAESGVKLIINNRPDGEDPGQPTSADVEAKAGEHGIAYRHIPMSASSLSLADIDNFADALEQSEGQVLAYCRSGYRSALLWALANVRTKTLEPIAAQESAAAAGHDLSSAMPVMNQLSET